MNSPRSAVNLLRNVYRAKGTTAFDISRLEPVLDADYPGVELILMCVKCGAESSCFLDVCPVCGRILSMRLESNRVRTNRDYKINRDYKKAQARSGGRRNDK